MIDPFAGSATTCLAARQLGRQSIGIELSPLFADEAARRIRSAIPPQLNLFAQPPPPVVLAP